MIIDRDKIDEAKQKLGDLNAEIMAELLGLEDYDKRNHKSLCPFHREDTGSFVYNSKGYYFKCFGCGKTVDLIGAHMHTGMTYIDACKKLFELSDTKYSFGEHKVKTKAQYRYPKEIEINDKTIVYKYLESRGISRSVVDYCDVRQDNHGNIAFNFYDTNDVLTMVKYRPSHKVDKASGESKSWSQKDADTTPLLLNMNRINTAEPLLITEGECLSGDTEVLTPNGWVSLEDYENQDVMQVNQDGTSCFVKPNAYIKKEYSGEMYEYNIGGNYSLKTTPNHNWAYINKDNSISKMSAESFVSQAHVVGKKLPTVSHHDSDGLDMSYDMISLYLAVSADGAIRVRKTFEDSNRCDISFKKERKKERLSGILERLSIPYSRNDNVSAKGYSSFSFYIPKWFKKEIPIEFATKSSLSQKRFILDEMVYWDGNSVVNRSQTEYSTKLIHNANVMQLIAHTSGKMSTIMHRHNSFGEWYKVSVLNKSFVTYQKRNLEKTHHDGFVYCVNVDSGIIMTRRNMKIAITGNCDMLAAIQSGYMNTVSVPFGAGNFGWIEENWDWLEQFDSIIIGSDNDEAGLKMQKECIYRLGSWRTKIMDIPTSIECDDGVTYKIKDINEFMFLAGEEQVMYAILNAKETPVESLIDFSDIKEVDLSQIDGVYTGIEEFDREMMRLFYGTFNILTGINGCVDSETEYFNGKEWKNISQYSDGEMVLQYNMDRTASLVVPSKYHKYECSKFWKLKSAYGVDQCVSDEHNIVYETSKGNIQKKNILEVINMHSEALHGFSGKFITTFGYSGDGIDLSDDEIRVMCAVVCDGSFFGRLKTKNRCRINIKKKRKQDRLRILLKNANIQYEEHKWNPKDKEYTSFVFDAPVVTKEFDSYWYNCSSSQLMIITDEVLHWDGSVTEKRKSFSTCIKQTADFIQFAFSSCGYRSYIYEYDRVGSQRGEYTRKSKEYHVSVTKQTKPTIFNCKNKIDIENVETGDGYKYCFTVPSGMLVLRRHGSINITGNSGKSSFLHQLIAQSVDQGKDVWLYSKELPNYMSKNWQDYIFAGGRHIIEYTNDRGSKYYRVTEEAKREIDEHYRGRIKIYRDGWKNDIESIQTSMIESVRKFGSKLFIVDNLTAINFACGDNEKWGKQVDFVNWCIDFAQRYHVVLILVIHPKKIEAMRRLTKLDVAGLGSIVDLAHRLISLYRVSPKEKEGMKKMTGQGWVSEPVKFDVILDVLKDRMRGRENMSIGLNYDVPSRRFFTNEEEYSYQYAWDKRKYKDKMFYPIVDDEEEVFGSK